jgi:hypothetical protein
MSKRDLLWALAYPLYQLLGSFRHEASHALVAIAQGATITDFVIWPTSNGWGYVDWEGRVTVASIAAPYVCDLMTFLVFFVLCMRKRFWRRWVWVNAGIIGIASPLVNSFFNYESGLRGPNDVGWLLERVSPVIVHGYFWLTMLLYAVGLVLALTVSRTARAPRLGEE